MRIKVKLFAVIRERAGRSEVFLDLPAGATVVVAAGALAEQLPTLGGLVNRTAYAINRSYVKPSTTLNDGDELALIPPVSGG